MTFRFLGEAEPGGAPNRGFPIFFFSGKLRIVSRTLSGLFLETLWGGFIPERRRPDSPRPIFPGMRGDVGKSGELG